MPVSKHRKKGQAKAVRRPGRRAVAAEPPWMAKERRIIKTAHRALRTDDMDDDEFEMVGFALDVVLDELLTINEDGTDVIARSGSASAVIEEYCRPDPDADSDADPDAGPVDDPALAAEMRQALLRFAACGLVRLDGDELVPLFAVD